MLTSWLGHSRNARAFSYTFITILQTFQSGKTDGCIEKPPRLLKCSMRSSELDLRGADLTASMNSLVHGKPDSARWNQTGLSGEQAGHAPSKLLHRPDLSDEVSSDAIAWLAVTLTMMITYFPDARAI